MMKKLLAAIFFVLFAAAAAAAQTQTPPADNENVDYSAVNKQHSGPLRILWSKFSTANLPILTG